MLIAKIFVNDEQIDELHIQRLDPLAEGRMFYSYKIRLPKGWEEHIIVHNYYEPWQELIKKALDLMNNWNKSNEIN